MNRTCFLVLMVVLFACKPQKTPNNPEVWKKVKIDFKKLDAEGLTGPAMGKVAMNYEFCIPAVEKQWHQVRKIDPTAQRNSGKGRVACQDSQWLVIGSTHQKNYQHVLFQLASLQYVEAIEPVFWE